MMTTLLGVADYMLACEELKGSLRDPARLFFVCFLTFRLHNLIFLFFRYMICFCMPFV